jgi:hypothetical protein
MARQERMHDLKRTKLLGTVLEVELTRLSVLPAAREECEG